ncbi:element excision factor XisI family protein [Lusitaniella coriacea LEGE 07167]
MRIIEASFNFISIRGEIKLFILHDLTLFFVCVYPAGIPKDSIVLGFHPADVRPHTGYAVV